MLVRGSMAPPETADPAPDAVPPGPELPLPGLGPLGWLFVVGAVLVVAVRVRLALPAPTLLAAGLPADVAQGMGTLVPAALLLRVPAAPRTHPLLFGGLALGALAGWALTAAQYLSATWIATPLAEGLVLGLYLAMAAASLAVGFGLLHLRPRGPTRGWLLGLFVAIDLGAMLAELGLPAAAAHQALLAPAWLVPSLPFVLLASTPALASWVAVSAWLDRDAPRAFWTLLALGFPLGLLGQVAALAALGPLLTPPVDPAGNGLYLSATALHGLLAAAGALLALVAYGRAAPRTLGSLDG